MSTTSPMTKKRYDQIILFGDSITEWSTNTEAGFALQPALQSMYSRKLDVVNRGFSGYNTAHALRALPQFMPSPDEGRVRLLVIFFGANDACLPSNPSDQHVPLATYRSNLKAILEHGAVRAHSPRTVIVSPPPVDEEHLVESGFEPGGRTAEVTAQYADAARDVARQTGIPCCDLWSVFLNRATGGRPITKPIPGDSRAPRNQVLRDLLADGLHFTPDAYRLMFDSLREVILASFPELDPEAMEFVFPPWRDAPKIED